MKPRLLILAGTTLATIVGVFSLAFHDVELPTLGKNGVSARYLTVVSSYDVTNGDFSTPAGTKLHFNEEGVDENGLIINPLGGLYLTTPINGLHTVHVILNNRNYGLNFTFAWCSAPYEAMDVFDGSYDGDHAFTTENCDDLPPLYFSITNPSSTQSIRIQQIGIEYQCESNFNGISTGPLSSLTYPYDDLEQPGTLNWDITAPMVGDKSCLDLDKFDRRTRDSNGNTDPHEYPGTYPIGFTASSALQEDHAFQFSRVESYTIEGMSNNKHAVTFHNSIEHESGDVFAVTHGTDFSGPYPAKAIWDAPINNFKSITEDRHYYPVMNAFGFDPNGHCAPISVNWLLNEGHVDMPEPDKIDDGYRFVGWYTDPQLSEPFDYHKSLDTDIVLYARIIKSEYPIRPVYYYDKYRDLESIDYAVLNQTSGDQPYGSYTVKTLYDDAFYYNADDEAGYCKTDSVLNVTQREGPVTILTFTDTRLVNPHHHDYHLEYREEKVTGDTFNIATHFSDRKGYRESTNANGDIEPHMRLPALPFHVADGETFKTITSTDGYIYPYARRNTYLDDMDALTEIGAYAYACYRDFSAKPLYGLSGHNRVMKVGRRAFFNRFGLADNCTYFPPNVKIFDTEAYANVFFNNNILMLPNTLESIGPRCFIGSRNINRVYLPKTLKSVGANAFANGTFNAQMDEFVNISNTPHIDFYYQGSRDEFLSLTETTRQRIQANARSITYDVELSMPTPTDYRYVFDCPYTQDYSSQNQEEQL